MKPFAPTILECPRHVPKSEEREWHCRPSGICPRGTAPVDPASLDRAASARVVISEFRLAPKQRHGRTELDSHRIDRC